MKAAATKRPGPEQAPQFHRPKCDHWETEQSLIYDFDLPGLSPDEIHVEIRGFRLGVWGERRAVAPESGGSAELECEQGRFGRSFLLPATASRAEASATYSHGVLQVVVPKVSPKSRTILCVESVPHRELPQGEERKRPLSLDDYWSGDELEGRF